MAKTGEYSLPLLYFSQHDYINTQPSHDHINTKLSYSSYTVDLNSIKPSDGNAQYRIFQLRQHLITKQQLYSASRILIKGKVKITVMTNL